MGKELTEYEKKVRTRQFIGYTLFGGLMECEGRWTRTNICVCEGYDYESLINDYYTKTGENRFHLEKSEKDGYYYDWGMEIRFCPLKTEYMQGMEEPPLLIGRMDSQNPFEKVLVNINVAFFNKQWQEDFHNGKCPESRFRNYVVPDDVRSANDFEGTDPYQYLFYQDGMDHFLIVTEEAPHILTSTNVSTLEYTEEQMAALLKKVKKEDKA